MRAHTRGTQSNARDKPRWRCQRHAPLSKLPAASTRDSSSQHSSSLRTTTGGSAHGVRVHGARRRQNISQCAARQVGVVTASQRASVDSGNEVKEVVCVAVRQCGADTRGETSGAATHATAGVRTHRVAPHVTQPRAPRACRSYRSAACEWAFMRTHAPCGALAGGCLRAELTSEEGERKCLAVVHAWRRSKRPRAHDPKHASNSFPTQRTCAHNVRIFVLFSRSSTRTSACVPSSSSPYAASAVYS